MSFVVGAAVDYLESCEFVFVFLDELVEVFYGLVGFFFRIGVKACVEKSVFADRVYSLFAFAVQVDQEVSEIRGVKRNAGFRSESFCGFFELGG